MEDVRPEGSLVQGLVVISIIILLLTLFLITVFVLVRQFRRPHTDQVQYTPRPLPAPPPITRMCSAPAALGTGITQSSTIPGNLLVSLETLLKPIIKSSVSGNTKRVVLETEV